MKNIKFLSLIALLATGSFFLSNCTGTEETPDPTPVLNFIGGPDFQSSDVSLTANTAFQIGITASHEKNITSFTITQSVDGSTDVVVLDSSDIKTKSISEYIYNGTTGPNEGTEIYTFVVSDNDGNSTTKAITITNLGDGGSNLAVLTEDNDGDPFRVWNVYGPNTGAYEIGFGDVSTSSPNTEKDIQDSTTVDEITAWPARWSSRNGTTYKVAPAGAWSTVTNERGIEVAWDEAGEATTFVDVEEGTSYLLNLKGANRYALVEITKVESTDDDNLDYIEFIYKYEQF